MIGAIIGDIVGSIYEWNNHRSKEFPLFGKGCFATDDSIMTLAVAKALLDCNGDYKDLSNKAIKAMQEVGRPYPHSGFGGEFFNWIYTDNPKPYGSFGNGAAMRVSAVGFVAKDIEQAKELAYKVTAISHNHPEGIKGAESVAVAIVLAKQGWTKEDIKDYVCAKYYDIDFTLDEICDTYKFNETCQNTVPQSFEAFFESNSFEDAIRNAISVGGDSDTLAAITGGIAEAYYGVPKMIRMKAWDYLDSRLKAILRAFEDEFGRDEPKLRKDRVPYQKWMFDIYKEDLNPEHWCDEFPSLMWGLGFEMDCYASFKELYPNAACDERAPRKREDRILDKLAQSDVQVVGNYIFSRFRELTHWSDYGYEPEKAEYFFPKAFEILEQKILLTGII
jgi:ADP-ribosylglycohydrolase